MKITVEASALRWPHGPRPELFRLTFCFAPETVPDGFKAALWPLLAAAQVQPVVRGARHRPAFAARFHRSPVATLTTLSADSLGLEDAKRLAELGRRHVAAAGPEPSCVGLLDPRPLTVQEREYGLLLARELFSA